MKKGLIFGIIAGTLAAGAAAVYLKKKNKDMCCYDDDYDDTDADFECDSCCGECCECDDDCDCTDIPAEKAEESVIITDTCEACGCSEEESLDSVEDEVESNEV